MRHCAPSHKRRGAVYHSDVQHAVTQIFNITNIIRSFIFYQEIDRFLPVHLAEITACTSPVFKMEMSHHIILAKRFSIFSAIK